MSSNIVQKKDASKYVLSDHFGHFKLMILTNITYLDELFVYFWSRFCLLYKIDNFFYTQLLHPQVLPLLKVPLHLSRVQVNWYLFLTWNYFSKNKKDFQCYNQSILIAYCIGSAAHIFKAWIISICYNKGIYLLG